LAACTVQAHDEVTGKAGTASGAIAHDGDVSPQTSISSTFGNVRGVVRRPDADDGCRGRARHASTGT
jgi:hypothetical protein